MPDPSRLTCNNDQLPKEFSEIRGQIELLPKMIRDRILPLCEKVSQFARMQGRLVRIAQEAVDQLQLDVKYLIFDLEATRRERDSLREELES